MDKRYEKNGIFTSDEMTKLSDAKVCIIGCGGLGGYVAEMLVRVGVTRLTIVDFDCFDESNLNRQLLALESNIGIPKVQAARERLKSINSSSLIKTVDSKMTESNVLGLIAGHDVVVDALDSIQARFVLQEACETNDIPMVHGAIAGWYGQVATIYPGDNLLAKLYKNNKDKGVESDLGNPAFTPATIASIQVSEVIKVLLNKEVLRHKVLMIDLLDNEFNIITM